MADFEIGPGDLDVTSGMSRRAFWLRMLTHVQSWPGALPENNPNINDPRHVLMKKVLCALNGQKYGE